MSNDLDFEKISDDACVTADDLLRNGIGAVKILREGDETLETSDAVLVLAHVLAAQNDMYHIEQTHYLERIADALEQIVESTKQIAEPYRRLDSEAENLVTSLLQQQAIRDQKWLEGLVKKAMPDLTEGEYQAAFTRIAHLIWPKA